MTDGPIASAVSRCYQIAHHTVYRYSDVVTSSYGRGFLIPRDSARQRCLSHELIIEPEAADSSTSLWSDCRSSTALSAGYCWQPIIPIEAW